MRLGRRGFLAGLPLLGYVAPRRAPVEWGLVACRGDIITIGSDPQRYVVTDVSEYEMTVVPHNHPCIPRHRF